MTGSKWEYATTSMLLYAFVRKKCSSVSTIVFFKRLGSWVFHDLFKSGALEIRVNFSTILSDISLDDCHEYNMSIGLNNRKRPVFQLQCCHYLQIGDGESGLKRLAIGYVVYSIQTGVRLNQGHYIKGNHPL